MKQKLYSSSKTKKNRVCSRFIYVYRGRLCNWFMIVAIFLCQHPWCCDGAAQCMCIFYCQRLYGSQFDSVMWSFCNLSFHSILRAIGHDSGRNSIEEIKTANDALHFMTCDLIGCVVCTVQWANIQVYHQYHALNAEKVSLNALNVQFNAILSELLANVKNILPEQRALLVQKNSVDLLN